MEGLKEYILSVAAAAMICGIVLNLFPRKGTSAKLVKITAGVILALTALSPLKILQIDRFDSLWTDHIAVGQFLAGEGESMTRNSVCRIIKENCEAYILTKAEELNLQLQVEVQLSGDDIPLPVAVRLQGNAAPYARTTLATWIEQDLGIPKENQLWIGQES